MANHPNRNTQARKALNDAIDMLRVIHKGGTYDNKTFFANVVRFEQALDPALDNEHGALVRFYNRMAA